jgi:hypothetical protein
MQPQSKSIISRFGNRRRGGDSISMLQCKAASLVNIAHSRKFHEPTFQQLGVRVRKIKQNASYSWMDNVLTAANAPRNDATPGGEAKFVFENGCQQLILGTGQMGNVHLSPEAEAYFAKTRFIRLTTRMRRRSAFFTLPARSARGPDRAEPNVRTAPRRDVREYLARIRIMTGRPPRARCWQRRLARFPIR